MSRTTASDQPNPADGHVDPEDAVGQLVAYENSTGDRQLYRLIEVFDDDGEQKFRAKSLHTGHTRTLFPERYPPNIFMPRIGEEFPLFVFEHQRGNGEWVETTPENQNPFMASNYHGEYTAQEETRLRKKAFIYRGDNEADYIETTVDDPETALRESHRVLPVEDSVEE